METQNKNSKGAVATGIIAALAASSCCIPPVIAAIAGVGGAAGSLSWMEPLRPYLIGLAVVAIGYAWYNHLKPKKEDDLTDEPTTRLQPSTSYFWRVRYRDQYLNWSNWSKTQSFKTKKGRRLWLRY